MLNTVIYNWACTHISCLFLPALSCYDSYFSFRARITNRTRFTESNFGVFLHYERRIFSNYCMRLSRIWRNIWMNNKHIYVCFCQHTVATINIPFRARIANRTLLRKHFWCFSTFRTRNIQSVFLCGKLFTYVYWLCSAYSKRRFFSQGVYSWGRFGNLTLLP